MRSAKKLLCGILTIIICTSTMFVTSAAAAGQMYTDDNVIWLYRYGTVSDACIVDYNSNNQNTSIRGTLKIPSKIKGYTVTGIDTYGFASCLNLESVVIPDTVKAIKEGAFLNCTKLKSVTIPKTVTTIEKNAFMNCDNITDIYYNGTESDWAKITSDKLSNYAIFYNSGALHLTGGSGADSGSDTESGTYYDGTKIPNYKTITGRALTKKVTTGEATTYYYTYNKSELSKYMLRLLQESFLSDTEESNRTGTTVYNKGNDRVSLYVKSSAIVEVRCERLKPTHITVDHASYSSSHTFIVSAATTTPNCTVYAVIYDSKGNILNISRKALEIGSNTTISTKKTTKDATAKIFVWTNKLQPQSDPVVLDI